MGNKIKFKIQIWAAVIGAIGLIIASLIGNWEKITSKTADKKSHSISQSVSGDGNNIINNNTGKINVNK